MMKKFYETPQVEVIEIEVEKGFATSGGDPVIDPDNPGPWDN